VRLEGWDRRAAALRARTETVIMSTIRSVLFLAIGITAGAGGAYWYDQRPVMPASQTATASTDHAHAAATARAVLYYRDPSGAPEWSATPKSDAHGRAFLPVHDDEEISFDPPPSSATTVTGQGSRKILYYRNPMGLADTSPVAKKDAMGMDYIPVYADESDDGGDLKITPGRVQRAGVRTEAVEERVIVKPVRAVGSVAVDEKRVTLVTLRAEGFIEELFVSTSGQDIAAGQPLFRVYSPQIQQAQTDFLVAIGASQRGVIGADAPGAIAGAIQRLRNLDVPDFRIKEVREARTNPRTIDWPSPATGTVVAKKVIAGQRVDAGDELYRIVDLTTVWVIADVAESDIGAIKIGQRATVTFKAYPDEPVEGTVTLVYHEMKPETRTGRVRIEIANPKLRFKTDMYADVMFRTGADDVPVVAVPDSAVLDDGVRQVVLVAKGDGRFEPRTIKLGRRGGGYREVVKGLAEGEEIVTSANFLIDAESNLRAALKTFSADGQP
jgi:membrane fusion protein, copper/silver efflux system